MLTYMIDIDGTICTQNKGVPYKYAAPIRERIKFFNDLYDIGHKIIYWTARGVYTKIDHSKLTEKQLNEWGVKRTELRMGKPSYDFWIDDKAFNVDDFFVTDTRTGETLAQRHYDI